LNPADRSTSAEHVDHAELGELNLDELVRKAQEAQGGAYAPYSDFKVGAVILSGGRLFRGANVENASHAATICAERVAAAHAVAAGFRDLEAMAVVSSGLFPSAPCGICRQFLFEFSPELLVVAEGRNGERRTWRLSELLVDGFGSNDLAGAR
jgi:cytidine deaminase